MGGIRWDEMGKMFRGLKVVLQEDHKEPRVCGRQGGGLGGKRRSRR